jgi:hypothetical protein
MKLASSSYYYQPNTELENRDQSYALLRDDIERLQAEFPGYGYRRLGQQLRREGVGVNDKKIRRIQRKYKFFPIRWMSSSDFPISSRRYITANVCIQRWVICLQRNSRWPFNQPKPPVAPPSNLAEISPAAGAQSNPFIEYALSRTFFE